MVSEQSQDETEQQPTIGRIPGLIAAVAIVGIAIGAAAGLLTLMLYQVERFALGYIENAHESGPFNVPAIRRAISVTVGASIAAVIWWLLRTRTTTVPSVKKAVGGALMPVWLLSTQWEGKNFLFAMNGQTGKIWGRLPVDKRKLAGLFFGVFFPVFAALMIGGWFL